MILQEKELFRKLDNYKCFTLGNFHETETEYIVYDGADYIGYSKNEYELRELRDGKWINSNQVCKPRKQVLLEE